MRHMPKTEVQAKRASELAMLLEKLAAQVRWLIYYHEPNICLWDPDYGDDAETTLAKVRADLARAQDWLTIVESAYLEAPSFAPMVAS